MRKVYVRFSAMATLRGNLRTLYARLVDYVVSPQTLGGELIPPGAVRRVLFYYDKLRHERGARRPGKEIRYFPAISTYIEFRQDAIRFVLRYDSNRSAIGRHILHIPRDDSPGRRRATYPLKTTPLLGVKGA